MGLLIIASVYLAIAAPNKSLADCPGDVEDATCVCDASSDLTVCFKWGDLNPPEEDEDFFVTWTDPDYPDVSLQTGSFTWQVWSYDDGTSAIPSHVGNLGHITSPAEANFGLTLQRPDDAAADVASRDIETIFFDGQFLRARTQVHWKS